MRVLLDHPSLHDQVQLLGYHAINLFYVPQEIKPYVSADWKVSDDVEQIELWLDANKRGKAILIDSPCNATEHLEPRCERARNWTHALRILRRAA